MRSLLTLALVTTASALPARAQAVNVSFGDPASGPSPAYAAAGAPGTWNSVTGEAGLAFDLVGLDGAATGVTLSQQPTIALIADSDPSVTGDDGQLLNRGLLTNGSETCLALSGFAPGTYEVLTYAWTPNAPLVKSRTRQDEAPSTIDVGGAWSGAHEEGVTYARYIVVVDDSGALPAHSGLAPGQPTAAFNGIQIRPLPDATAGGFPAGTVRLHPFPSASSAPPAPSSSGTPDGATGGCSSAGGGGPAGAVLVALLVARRTKRSVANARAGC